MATIAETYTGGPAKPTIDKDPNAVLDYSFDWTDYLAPYGDAIASVLFVLEPGLVEEGTGHTANGAVVWVSGGVVDTTMRVTCRITTTNTPPRVDDRSIFLKIKER